MVEGCFAAELAEHFKKTNKIIDSYEDLQEIADVLLVDLADDILVCSICHTVPFKPRECPVCQRIACDPCALKHSSCTNGCGRNYKKMQAHLLYRHYIGKLRYRCPYGCSESLCASSLL
jgi:hypothetical protein